MMRRGRLSAATTVEEVLRSAAERRDSGAVIFDGDAPGSVYLLDGLVYWATTEAETPFDEALLHRGLLTREQLAHVRREVAAGRDLAFVLASEPGVNGSGIVQLVHDRSVAALGVLLAATSGSFVVDPYAQHPEGVLGQWGTGSMLALATRRFELQERPLGVAPEQRQAHLSPTFPAEPGDDLSALELRFCGGVGDGRTVAEVAAAAELSVAAAVELSERLAERGVVVLTEPPVTAASAPAPPRKASTATPAPPAPAPAAPPAPAPRLNPPGSVIVTLPAEPPVPPAPAKSPPPEPEPEPELNELPAAAGDGWRPTGFLARRYSG